jgi:hypothetical protein
MFSLTKCFVRVRIGKVTSQQYALAFWEGPLLKRGNNPSNQTADEKVYARRVEENTKIKCEPGGTCLKLCFIPLSFLLGGSDQGLWNSIH